MDDTKAFSCVVIRPFYGLEVRGFKCLLPKHIYVNMSQIQGSFLDKNMASILKIISMFYLVISIISLYLLHQIVIYFHLNHKPQKSLEQQYIENSWNTAKVGVKHQSINQLLKNCQISALILKISFLLCNTYKLTPCTRYLDLILFLFRFFCLYSILTSKSIRQWCFLWYRQ